MPSKMRYSYSEYAGYEARPHTPQQQGGTGTS